MQKKKEKLSRRKIQTNTIHLYFIEMLPDIQSKFQDIQNYSLEKIFLSLGTAKIGIKYAEKNSLIFRRSIFAIKEIKKGEKLKTDNIKTFRPKIGIGSEHYLNIIGKKEGTCTNKN